MALRILAGWTFGDANAIEFEIEEVTGGNTFNIRFDESGGWANGLGTAVTETRYCHETMGTIGTGLGGYADFATDLKAVLEIGSVLAGSSLTYTVTWSTTQLRYTLSASGSGLAGIRFTGVGIDADDAARAAELLGFSGNDTTGAIVGDITAAYSIDAAMGCKSNPTEVYEPDGAAEGGWTSGGAHFGISVVDSILFDDFDLYFESKEATFKESATTSVPWTYQDFWENARASEPFIVVDDVDSRVHFLRPDGSASFKPERAVANWDDAWHHKLRTIMAGYL